MSNFESGLWIFSVLCISYVALLLTECDRPTVIERIGGTVLGRIHRHLVRRDQRRDWPRARLRRRKKD